MCEVTTVLLVAGLVLGVAGGVQQANAQKANAEFQEDQAKENAKGAEAQAQSATMTGLVEEDRQRQRTRAFLASQRTTLAANNLDMSTGTPLELLGDTAAMGEQDALTIRANAAREAWGYRSQSVDFRNQGAIARATGKNQSRATYLTTAGNAATSGATAYSGYRAPANTTNRPTGAGAFASGYGS